VLPQEIQRDANGQQDGAPAGNTFAKITGVLLVEVQRLVELRRNKADVLEDQTHDVLPGRYTASRAGYHLIEHQCGHRKLGQETAHRLLDDLVHAAPHEERTAFDIYGSDGIAEEHHRQDEPRRGWSDRVFNDAADVVNRAREVAQDHRRRAPERDESEGDAANDDDRGDAAEPRRSRYAIPRLVFTAARRPGRPLRDRHESVLGTSPVREREGPFHRADEVS